MKRRFQGIGWAQNHAEAGHNAWGPQTNAALTHFSSVSSIGARQRGP